MTAITESDAPRIANPLVEDFADVARLDAAERFRAEHEVGAAFAKQGLHPVQVQLHVRVSLHVERERDAGSDDHCDGPIVTSAGRGEHEGESLAVCDPNGDGRSQVHQCAIFNLSGDVSVLDDAHASPSVAAQVLDTPDAVTTTVGDSAGSTGSPSGESVAPPALSDAIIRLVRREIAAYDKRSRGALEVL